VYEIIFNIC